jgi:hypothetical protein
VPEVVTRSEAAFCATDQRIRSARHFTRLVRFVRGWIAVLAWVSVAGCSSTNMAVSGPTGRCQVTVDNSAKALGPEATSAVAPLADRPAARSK